MILESITFAGIAAVCAHISPIVTLGKGALDVVKHSNEWRHVESAREILRKTRNELADVKHGSDIDKFLDHWLTHGEMIYPYVKQKLLNRFLIAVVVIISAQIGAAELRGVSSHDTTINLIQIFVQLTSAFIVNRHTIMSRDEKKFLKCLVVLRKMWYDEYVLPTVTSFNEKLAPIITKPKSIGTTDWEQKYGVISMRFQMAQKEEEEFLKAFQKRLLPSPKDSKEKQPE